MDHFIQRHNVKFPARTDGNDTRTPLGSGSANLSKRRQGKLPLQDPPSKKARVGKEEGKNSGGDDDEDSSSVNTPSGDLDSDIDDDDDGDHPHQTAFEVSLPAVATDKVAIQQYEAMRASQSGQDDAADSASTRLENRKWVPGKNSIYVDAFNLALDTVLEDESHLFDIKEKDVFDEWKNLSYEAQYLYVRLFLRKTASWHRFESLNHYTDILNIEDAIADLQRSRSLPDDQLKDGKEKEDLLLGRSFMFADNSESSVTTLEEAATLVSLNELKVLAKEGKVFVLGKTKPEIIKAFCHNSARQSSLFSVGLRRSDSDGSTDSKDSNRNSYFLARIFAITGPLIRLSEPIFKLFERVHLVFYRSTEWTEKSLTTIILAKAARRNFPEYIVSRSSNIFPSRRHLVEFELSMRKQFELDEILDTSRSGKAGFLEALELFEDIAPRWRELIKEEQHREDNVYEFGEGGYLRRFNAAHAFTRIAHKAAWVLGRLHRYKEEHALLVELLSQRLFHPSRRGYWYQRKALLEEHYMWKNDPGHRSTHLDIQRKQWLQIALITCETGLQDRDCHLIYHFDLQKRLLKLEKRLGVPFRSRHDFGHVKLLEPEEHTVRGIQLVRDDPGNGNKLGRTTKTTWLDELGVPDENGKPPQVRVEEMCLSHYRSEGWKGYHSEGGILRTLFAYLFFDVLFVYVPNVFQTAYQTCPLDLFTDAFYPARSSQINHRLVEIANGDAERILREVHERESERRTCVVGLNWDFDINDLAELVACFDGGALAAVCKVIAEDYKDRGRGVPDLILWRPEKTDSQTNEGVYHQQKQQEQKGEVMFAEVKTANDRLSDAQRLWIHVLTGAGVRVALCNAVAKEVRPLK
ncbi:VRR-NUC domain-containing protein [Podospora fimiseda]|uniref:Fanconi-associated nuclease n=1 Tax=Podospora fimiseda TaxID=252190 RepID=A0AAN7BWL5_9PEZI|nr:VRR-NUC domain-containing protein [Podospora fimiseda]